MNTRTIATLVVAFLLLAGCNGAVKLDPGETTEGLELTKLLQTSTSACWAAVKEVEAARPKPAMLTGVCSDQILPASKKPWAPFERKRFLSCIQPQI